MNAIHIKALSNPIKPGYLEPFSGDVYKIGHGFMSVRKSSNNVSCTVIGVHGFLENHCYFTSIYSDPDVELILQTCCHYHLPIVNPNIKYPDWEIANKSPENTISYDANILTQGIERLPSTNHIRVHGHSRGCAIIIEAARRRPDLFRNVEVILEAPVLPGGELHPLFGTFVEAMTFTLWPTMVSLGRKMSKSPISQLVLGAMKGRKRHLLENLLNSTRDALTIVRNVEDLVCWMRQQPISLLDNILNATLLLPKQDRILKVSAMKLAAASANQRVKVVCTECPSHFIALDHPEMIPDIKRKRREKPTEREEKEMFSLAMI